MSERDNAVAAAWAARKAFESLRAYFGDMRPLSFAQNDFAWFCAEVFNEDELAAIRDGTEGVA